MLNKIGGPLQVDLTLQIGVMKDSQKTAVKTTVEHIFLLNPVNMHFPS